MYNSIDHQKAGVSFIILTASLAYFLCLNKRRLIQPHHPVRRTIHGHTASGRVTAAGPRWASGPAGAASWIHAKAEQKNTCTAYGMHTVYVHVVLNV